GKNMSPPSPNVIDITSPESFQRDVIDRSREVPVVVDFWATWCGPCRVLGPVLERLANEGNGRFILAKVDVDRVPELAHVFRITGIPDVKAFRNGRIVDEFSGVLPESELRQFIDQLAPPILEDDPAQSARELEAIDPAGAEAEYRKTLEEDPENAAAKLGLVRLLIARGAFDAAREIAENAVVPEEDTAELEALKARISLADRAKGLAPVDALEARVRDEPESPQAHYELGCARAAAGSYGPALEALLRAAELDRSFGRRSEERR